MRTCDYGNSNVFLVIADLLTCRPGTFQCTSGHCIPEALRCDGRPDCLDFSDESTCRKFAGLKRTVLNSYRFFSNFLYPRQQPAIQEDAGVHHTSFSVTTRCVWTSSGCAMDSTTAETVQMNNSTCAVRHYSKTLWYHCIIPCKIHYQWLCLKGNIDSPSLPL